MWGMLDDRLERVFEANANCGRKEPFGERKGMHEQLAASDACKDRAAYVCLSSDTVVLDKLFEETIKHITRKETWPALRTLRKLLSMEQPQDQIRYRSGQHGCSYVSEQRYLLMRKSTSACLRRNRYLGKQNANGKRIT